MHSKFKTFVFCLLAWILSQDNSVGLVFYNEGEYDPAIHDRFYTGDNPDFIGKEFDWSGIGRLYGRSRWATMITDHFFVSAKHAHPSEEDNLPILFWETNNWYDATSREIVWTAYVPNSVEYSYGPDICVGMLDEKLPNSFKRYSVYVNDIDKYNGCRVFYVGQPPTGFWTPTGYFSVGEQNYLDKGAVLYGTSLFAMTPQNIVSQSNNVYGFGGDSGAPTMAVVNGELALMGTHYTAVTDGFIAQNVEAINALIASAPAHNYERIKVVHKTQPKIETLQKDNSLFVTWPNTSGIMYIVETSNDLVDWQETLFEGTGGINKVWTVEYPNIENHSFIRIKYSNLKED